VALFNKFINALVLYSPHSAQFWIHATIEIVTDYKG